MDVARVNEQLVAITQELALLRAENSSLKQTVQVKVAAGEGSFTSFSKWVLDLKIHQVKEEFSTPNEKHAMGFMVGLSMDVKEVSSSFAKMLATCQKQVGELDLSSSNSQARMARAAYQVVEFFKDMQQKIKKEKGD